MMEQLNKTTQLLILTVCIFVLQACGGSSNTSNKYSISADTTSIALNNEFLKTSTRSIKVKINFQGDGLLVGFAPDSQPVPWLNYRTENVTTISATLYIDVINAQSLPVDLYKTTLRISTGDPSKPELVHQDINVSLLIWKLLSFGDTFGVTNIASQTLKFSNPSQQWTVSSDVNWLNVSSTFNSDTKKTTVTLTPDLSKISQAGLNQGNLVFSGLSGKTNYPVELGLDNVYLYADKANIAFTAIQNVNALKSIITIGSNDPNGFTWQAQTDASWLTLTLIKGSNSLQITADPNLAPDTELSTATIIISPKPDPAAPDAVSAVNNETIHISLYKSNLTATTQTINNIVTNTNAIVAAPLKPYIYVGVNNELRVYQQYTGKLLNTMVISPEKTKLEQFVIHPEGQLLIAQANEDILDANGNVTNTLVHRYKINLTDLTFTEISNATIQYDPIKFVRFAGRYFIVTKILEYADENLQRFPFYGSNTFNQTAFFAQAFDTAPVAQSIFAFDANTKLFKRFTAKVNNFTANKILTTMTNEYQPDNLTTNDNIRDFVISTNEKNIYAISPTSEWISFDGTTFIDNGLLETDPNIITLALTKSTNSLPIYARFDPSQGFIIDGYNDQQQLSATINTMGDQPNNIIVSADNRRVIINATKAQKVEIINLPPFNN